MREKSLLAFILLTSMISKTATAQTWQKWDSPTTTPFSTNDTVYLYNVQAKLFFSEGNRYGTQASLSADKPLKVCFTKWLDEEGNYDNKTLLFNDSSLVAQEWRKVFIDAKNEAYVDYKNDFFWQIEAIEGSDYFRIYPGDLNPYFNREEYDLVYFGLDRSINPSNTAISPLLLYIPGDERSESYMLDWAFVTLADFDSWKLHNETVDAALNLNDLISEAQAMGINTSDYEQVFNNLNSTMEQLNAASAELQLVMAEALEGIVTVSSPKNMTDYIVNPQYANDNNIGWEGTAPGFDTNNHPSCAEIWNGNFNIHQTLTNLPNGVYSIEVQAFYRTGVSAVDSYNAWLQGKDYNMNAIFYAISGEDNFSTPVMNIVADMQPESMGGNEQNPVEGYYVPDNMVAAGLYFNAKLYNNTLYAHVENGTLTIGLKKEQLISKDWTIWDNWRLTFYGNLLESYQFYSQQELKAAEPYLKTDIYYSQALRLQLEQLLAANDAATSKEEIIQLLQQFNSLMVEIKESVQAYSDYLSICQEAYEIISTLQGTGVDILSDYLYQTLDEIPYDELYMSGRLSTEEIQAEIEKVKTLIAGAYATSINVGADITYIIANPNFDNGVNGWSYDPTYPGRPVAGGLATNPNAEVYNANFDVYQEFTDVPNGVYRMDVQAFFRSGANDVAWDERETAEIKSHIYINDIQADIKNVMSEAQEEAFINGGYFTTPVGTYVANNMNETSEAFSAGKYENTLYGVVTEGTLRIGIRQTDGTAGARWTIFDNFRLTYAGYDPDMLRQALEPLVATAQTLQADTNIGKQEKAALEMLCTTALTSDNGRELFQVLININAAIDEARVSINNYLNLNVALNNLYDALDTYSSIATQEALDIAGALAEEIEEKIESKSLSTTEFDELMARVEAAVVQLKFVDEVASDDNPLDLTHAITNPSFDNDTADGWKGSSPGFDRADGLGMAEFYNTNYNIYQTINGLKNGTYAVGVTGFYRPGSFDYAYEVFCSNNPSENMPAYFYAESGDNKASISLPSICTGMSESPVNGGQGEVTVGGRFYVPNNMVSAAAYLNAERYEPTVLVIIVTNNILTIGLKNDAMRGGDWTFFDKFTLTYYGDESNKKPSEDDMTAVETLDNNSLTIASVVSPNGTTLSKLQRGVNILRMSNGSIRKVFIQ